jgi:hypothetical protein
MSQLDPSSPSHIVEDSIGVPINEHTAKQSTTMKDSLSLVKAQNIEELDYWILSFSLGIQHPDQIGLSQIFSIYDYSIYFLGIANI